MVWHLKYGLNPQGDAHAAFRRRTRMDARPLLSLRIARWVQAIFVHGRLHIQQERHLATFFVYVFTTNRVFRKSRRANGVARRPFSQQANPLFRAEPVASFCLSSFLIDYFTHI